MAWLLVGSSNELSELSAHSPVACPSGREAPSGSLERDCSSYGLHRLLARVRLSSKRARMTTLRLEHNVHWSVQTVEAGMDTPFKYDPQAALNAVLYVASRVAEPTFHKVSKLLYFADRKHLERYGRLIFGDNYVAMKNGPVPSRVYDLLKAARFNHFSVAAFEIEERMSGGRPVPVIRALQEPNLDELSQSDLLCLDEAIAEYGEKCFAELTSLSHDEAWKSADENDFISLEALARSLPNAEALLEQIWNPHP